MNYSLRWNREESQQLIKETSETARRLFGLGYSLVPFRVSTWKNPNGAKQLDCKTGVDDFPAVEERSLEWILSRLSRPEKDGFPRNLGICCVGQIVLDVDNKNGGTGNADFEELKGLLGDPLAGGKVPSVATPSGGFHFHFRAPEGWGYSGKNGLQIPGSQRRTSVDCKTGAKDTVLTAPSVYLDGNQYEEFIPFPALADLPELPEAWLEYLREELERNPQTSKIPSFQVGISTGKVGISTGHFEAEEVKAALRANPEAIERIYRGTGFNFPEGFFNFSPHSPESPCPLCGGKDRFRYTFGRTGGSDSTPVGKVVCNQCKPEGWDLFGFIEAATGKSFTQQVDEYGELLGLTPKGYNPSPSVDLSGFLQSPPSTDSPKDWTPPKPSGAPAEAEPDREPEPSVLDRSDLIREQWLDRKAGGIGTGIEGLDDLLGGRGIYPGLHVLGAIPGLGKTTLALQIADSIAATGKRVLFYSLEMERSVLVARSISRIQGKLALRQAGDSIGFSQIDFPQLGVPAWEEEAGYKAATEELSKEHFPAFETFSGEMGTEKIAEVEAVRKVTYTAQEVQEYGTDSLDTTRHRLFEVASLAYWRYIAPYMHVVEAGLLAEGFSTLALEQEIKRHAERYGAPPAAVFIDYLQILQMVDAGFSGSDKQKVDAIVTSLRAIAVRNKTPIIAISSLNRTSYNSSIKLESFKESGGIEFTADSIWGLQTKVEVIKGLSPEEEKADFAEQTKSNNRSFCRNLTLVLLKNRNGIPYRAGNFNYLPALNLFLYEGEQIDPEGRGSYSDRSKGEASYTQKRNEQRKELLGIQSRILQYFESEGRKLGKVPKAGITLPFETISKALAELGLNPDKIREAIKTRSNDSKYLTWRAGLNDGGTVTCSRGYWNPDCWESEEPTEEPEEPKEIDDFEAELKKFLETKRD